MFKRVFVYLSAFILSKASCKTKYVHLYGNNAYVISSPHYNLEYPNNIACVWLISSRDEPTASKVPFILFKSFINFHLEAGDHLTVGLGQTVSSKSLVYHFPGHLSLLPRLVAIQNNSIWLKFDSDKLFGAVGFIFHVEPVLDAIGKF